MTTTLQDFLCLSDDDHTILFDTAASYVNNTLSATATYDFGGDTLSPPNMFSYITLDED